ncbi:hypothetical protein [Trinickia dinghuensis]|uniref:Uncharacterized protein n=1 Tax=Trinickia dinghuensis TaxID=2291023 RepID=A0A3D8K3Q3_9BURK|nr:hypothetical protein [Trinickia dinghuensis]RDV00074.1 hypothetical protein DWV00_06775 [Trinickia dinghuensis]
MQKRLASRHSQTRMTLSPARLGRRTSMRALRHHAARADALSRREAMPVRAEHTGGSFRAWLRAVLSALRTGTRGTRARRVLLRRLLRRATVRRLGTESTQGSTATVGSRRPRRLSASAGWFAFAAR